MLVEYCNAIEYRKNIWKCVTNNRQKSNIWLYIRCSSLFAFPFLFLSFSRDFLLFYSRYASTEHAFITYSKFEEFNLKLTFKKKNFYSCFMSLTQWNRLKRKTTRRMNREQRWTVHFFSRYSGSRDQVLH